MLRVCHASSSLPQHAPLACALASHSHADQYARGRMAEQAAPSSRIQSFLQRTSDRLPPLSQLPHLARQSAPRLDPRQHPETLALQLTIKALSGVRADTASLARETLAYSKQLYVWTRDDGDERVRVAGDRAAWCAWKAGECENECAARIEQARVVLKDIVSPVLLPDVNELTKGSPLAAQL